MTDLKKSPHIVFFGLLGMAASLVVGIGEFLVHFSATGYQGAEQFLWLKTIDTWRISIGHFIMIAGMPLYLFGYWHFYLMLRNGSEMLARTVLTLGIVAFMIGGVWAGSRALLTELVKSENQTLIAYYQTHYEVLVQVLRILLFLISIIWVYVILKTKTHYPKWMAALNPVLILALVFISYWLVPTLGKYLVPTAMNVTHFILFLISTLIISKSTKE